ncbi:Erythroid differentiation-related factor 1 [Larimichthys crocea]|uniref:Uncharacterized protein n=1 Tax=Larimichthys crocea TaxID=215358 RepID=A0ACD3QCP0_LARCR|nr:Erythroid differentiation-related factor 1 [Larimichthys crocea]
MFAGLIGGVSGMSASAGDREPGFPLDNAKEDMSCTGDSSKHDSAVCSAGNSEIKSRAVVKYSAAPPPTSYALLQEKTDLKLPPANWLRENPQLGSAGTTILGSSSKGKPFSSFGMAYDFIDCIGDDVDVVSDSESSSLPVLSHNNFCVSSSINGDGAAEPVPDNLDEGEEESRAEEFCSSWPTTFTSTSSDAEESDCSQGGTSSLDCYLESVSVDSTFALGQVTSVPKEQNLPMLFNEGEDSQGLRNDFVRNIMWTFEDIHMLVGSNMPIFGGGRYPAVSLRLRDNNKPINILTGIDYWLDNLMCNVPELVMCFHVNGIVQKYEMIKTEDIPHLENSTFSTRVVKDIAQNILSFLKSNCTKEGHTYWLFKASGSDIVKLYDLTYSV